MSGSAWKRLGAFGSARARLDAPGSVWERPGHKWQNSKLEDISHFDKTEDITIAKTFPIIAEVDKTSNLSLLSLLLLLT